jgi:chemotaxis protein methyltransferase WspC
MDLTNFHNLLKASIGLDVATIGVSAVESAVQNRQRACGVADRAAYWERLRASETELQALIEAVVVPETWFFRDRAAFVALVRLVRDNWLPAHPEGVLHVLSLPCSTGEEPYSMAIALLDAGLAGDRFRVDAVDISERVLSHARRGIYGKRAFRGDDLGWRARHCVSVASGQSISEQVRRQVRFQQGNLLGTTVPTAAGIYDVIFCRNVLIYFDNVTQARALGVLSRLLTPAGVLFVSPSETGMLLRQGFVSTKDPQAYAFRRPGTGERVPPPVVAPARRAPERSAAPLPLVRPIRPVIVADRRAERPPSSGVTAVAASARSLDEGSRLADQGRFIEAARCCEEHLKEHGPSAQVFHLLGLVRDAVGRHADAAEYYRKALYLDPEHQETLLHFALLMESQNNAVEAQRLRTRARRLAQHSGQ